MDKKSKAKRIDLVEFCQKMGIPLIDERSSNPKLAEHDSLVFFPDSLDGQWYRFSTQEGGDSIAFVQYYYNVDFNAAMDMLLDSEAKEIVELPESEKNKPFVYSKDYEALDTSAAKKYLCDQRKIDPQIVDLFIKIGLIKQDNRNNVVFKWVENNKIIGSNRQGTAPTKEGERSWKKTDKNSLGDGGFNLKIGTPKTLRFFESAIDMLSYMSMNKGLLKNTWFISMEGLKKVILPHYLSEAMKELEDPPKIIFCIDNDKAGHKYAEDMLVMNSPYIFVEQPKNHKDWNDQLKSMSFEPFKVTVRDPQKKTVDLER